jgi:Uma2 family endonuclease
LGPLRPKRRGGPLGGTWWIVYEPELHLGGHVLVPDLAGWRSETMPQFPSAAHIDVVPDWVCEVVSPSSAGRDRVKKRRIYQTLGVAWYWIADPAAKTLEVLHLRDGEWVSVAAAECDEVVSLPPFDSIAIDLLELWIPDSTP